ncbi:MAG TPA: hypothetical protein VNA20_15825 [Frankiaceae bacterium]|nr:hypothetical protein [Frankiaceae bacterium]
MRLFLRTLFASALASVLVVSPGVSRDASASNHGTYVSGGTAVARADGQPVADEGSVVCDNGNGVGVGGLCLAFGGGNAVAIDDVAAGENVPYQVCVDNSGDGVCTSPDFGACADDVYFSHDDAGNFFNPVGPLPTGFRSGCSGGPWKGYVVFLCEGAHAVGAGAHTHAAVEGTGEVVTGGEGFGTFCGGTRIAQSRKPYTVGSGARYLSGGTAASRQNGKTVVDEGSVVCNNGDNVGVGGFCTSFGGGNAMAVFDAAAGTDVAFQVCVDNNGDGICTSPDFGTCADRVFFSHADNGAFYNPVGPLPAGFDPGCGARAWQGYVVFLCEGTHIEGITPHAHPATTGTGRVTTGGEGLGTFCGGSDAAPSRKRYRLDLSSSSNPCRLFATQNDDATGQVFQGFVQGSTAVADVSTVSVRCRVTVNGVTVAATPKGTGAGASTTFAQVSFGADETDVVRLCSDVSDGHSSRTTCSAATFTSVPGQATADLVAALAAQLGPIADPIACALLSGLAGNYGAVVVNAQGDVFVNGEAVLDCPPYDLGLESPLEGGAVRIVTAGF